MTMTPPTQGPASEWALSVRLPADAHAPRLCRRATVDAVRAYDLPSLADDSGLVASELMTNAWRHGCGPLSFRVAWYALRARLRITVWDGSGVRVPDTVGTHALPPDCSESGRGLFIVGSLAVDWGQHGTEGGGKATWAELASPASLTPR